MKENLCNASVLETLERLLDEVDNLYQNLNVLRAFVEMQEELRKQSKDK